MTPDDRAMEDEQLADLLDQYTTARQQNDFAACQRLLAQHPQLRQMVPCLDALESFVHAALPAGEPNQAAFRSAGHSGALGAPSAGTGSAFALPPQGRPFGKYLLLEQIGRGAAGVVYKALDKSLNRHVAVKVITAGFLATDRQIDHFLREARQIAGLRIPGVVAIREAGVVDGQCFLAMELIGGQSLNAVLRRGPLDPEAAARTLAAVARAVHSLHERSIVHQGLKPSNILLDEAGTPFVSDFGFMRMLSEHGARGERAAEAGTPAYTAPEQACGSLPVATAAGDVYSLGAILYAALAGRPPYVGETPADTLLQVLEGEPPALPSTSRHLPGRLSAICMKCLNKRPEERYATAKALADDLERALRGEPILVTPPAPIERLRRWARAETALALRLAVIILVLVIMQVGHALAGRPVDHRWQIKAVFAGWAALALALQRWAARPTWGRHSRQAWVFIDAFLLTVCLWLADGNSGPLVVGYPLLVVASGLWLDARLVWLSTAANLLSFAALVGLQPALRETPHYPAIVAAALCAVGAMTAHQVRRLRQVIDYFERRGH